MEKAQEFLQSKTDVLEFIMNIVIQIALPLTVHKFSLFIDWLMHALIIL